MDTTNGAVCESRPPYAGGEWVRSWAQTLAHVRRSARNPLVPRGIDQSAGCEYEVTRSTPVWCTSWYNAVHLSDTVPSRFAGGVSSSHHR